MFLQNPVSLQDFFHTDSSSFTYCKRPITFFFQDMQRTLDQSDLETIQLLLLSAHCIIYQEQEEITDAKFSLMQQHAEALYQQFLNEATFLFDCFRTLTYAEKQQKAFERQQGINASVQHFSFLPEDPPDAFFEEMFVLKESYGFYNLSKDACIHGYKNIYHKCNKQPILSLLLPTLFTVFSTDGIEFRNAYSYMKYKNRRLSDNSKNHVLILFQEISKVITRYFNHTLHFEVPIFKWPEIEARFCSHHKLSETDAKIVKQYFAKYRSQNDLSKSEERDLAKLPYGKYVRSVAKLCNLNVYTIMNEQNFDYGTNHNAIPAKAKKPYKYLLAGTLMPPIPPLKNCSHFDQYFGDLYDTVPSNPDFSRLALFRYYHLPFDSIFTDSHNFLADLEESVVTLTSKMIEKFLRRYREDQQVFIFQKGDDYAAENKRLNTRISYRLGNMELRQEYTRRAKNLSVQIAAKFTEQDYRDFIQNVANFGVLHFPAYLEHFCGKYSISVYSTASPKEKCYLEDEAFSTILTLIQNYLLKNIFAFWQEAISQELYNSNL